MESILHCSQSAFTKGRSLQEGFLVAQEAVNYYSHTRKKGIMVKLDFQKAFDCLNWNFIEEALAAHQFPEKWIKW